ncbi:alpha-amylase family protein [Virgisporangium aurantiacum]|uniref:Trehalose synthase n=1 Tax=Virgisporangium aurantiacum TaxID=175570 RepID=A0A8J4E478_9ACTN|nr:alpha-amylase family protein [Virgisporangium aurantiacum]GIJ61675.1 trehalose synthase [Virgisporangium aurantiacum]
MDPRWYTEAVIYSLDVDTYADSNGDGIGDIRGLIGRLDYLSRLGVTCLWLNPIHPTPGRDDGYDVTDFYGVDPRLGSLGDFAELLYRAKNLGIKVMIDLVVNHTSDEHPWFREAVAGGPKKDWYIWSAEEPSDRFQGMVFPGEQKETWTWHKEVQAWYYHRFYDFQPDLNIENPEVRDEIKRIVAFWLQLGVAGFRMDAVPFIIEETEPGNQNSPKNFDFLAELRSHTQWRRGDAILLAEANVEPDELKRYFTDDGGAHSRLHMLFDFMLNGRLVLALARGDAEQLIDALRDTPKLPDGAQWATFLRNHDEIDLSRLTAEQRADVFEEFGPEERMKLYDRGIRRRLAPMMKGDRRRLELAYSLQFTLRGTPVLRYGDEIGMGEDLSQDGRYAIRTPMQWSGARNAGFSTAPSKDLIRPVVSRGDFAFKKINVDDARHDRGSLLNWFERMIHTLRESPEVGCGTCTHVDVPVGRGVLVHRADGAAGTMLFLHNLSAEPSTVDLSSLRGEAEELNQVFADQDYEPLDGLKDLALTGYGYRWIRLRRSAAA